MQVIDFSRSFILWRVDMSSDKTPLSVTHKPPFSINTARVAVDCRCVITDRKNGCTVTYVLGASCKTERVGVERDIWTAPNADFMPLCSESKLMSIKTFACRQTRVHLYPKGRGAQPENHIVDLNEAFDRFDIAVTFGEGRKLSKLDAIIENTLNGGRLVARTVIENERYSATIDYPVKTMNVSDKDGFFQTDTGPMLLPDLSREPEAMLEGFQVAWAAVTGKTWGEFLVREVVEIGHGLSVHHYARSVRLEAIRNTLFVLDS